MPDQVQTYCLSYDYHHDRSSSDAMVKYDSLTVVAAAAAADD